MKADRIIIIIICKSEKVHIQNIFEKLLFRPCCCCHSSRLALNLQLRLGHKGRGLGATISNLKALEQ